MPNILHNSSTPKLSPLNSLRTCNLSVSAKALFRSVRVHKKLIASKDLFGEEDAEIDLETIGSKFNNF